MELANWNATAFNPATDSPNQIHSDEMAKAYGFQGGLVPGVVISSYLMHPAVVAWGEDWLQHGRAHIVVHKPLYDGFDFEVRISKQSSKTCEVQLIDERETCCASGTLSLGESAQKNSPRPTYRGDPILSSDYEVPKATPESMNKLQMDGMQALPIRWDNSHNMAYYLADQSLMPKIHQPDNNGFAHGSFLLGVTNWVLAANAYMNPWVHLETSSQFFAAVPYGSELIAECQIKDLFEKRGHQFVDLGVDVYTKERLAPVMTASLRAIYQMRAL